MDKLRATLEKLTGALALLGVRHMVVGGLANIIWGAARLTVDIDLAVSVPEEDVGELTMGLREAGFIVLVPDPEEFVRRTRVLPVRNGDGIRADLIFALLPFEIRAIERAMPVDFAGVAVPCCTAEDLIILKAVSTRGKDREDIRGIIDRRAARLDRDYLLPILKELAALLERSDLEELCRTLEV